MSSVKDDNAWVNVYEFLKDQIIKGIYGPGEKLNEREIAGLVNVSRTPTREALKILEHEGFVTKMPKKGVIVKKYSPEELDMLHRMLILLEGLAVKMAVPKLTEADLLRLENTNKRLKSLAAKKNYGDYLVLNIEFHLYFPKVTGSRELFDTIAQLRKKTARFYNLQITMADNSDQYIEHHRELVDALRGRVKEKPEKIMEKHIEAARKSFLGFYKKFGV